MVIRSTGAREIKLDSFVTDNSAYTAKLTLPAKMTEAGIMTFQHVDVSGPFGSK